MTSRANVIGDGMLLHVKTVATVSSRAVHFNPQRTDIFLLPAAVAVTIIDGGSGLGVIPIPSAGFWLHTQAEIILNNPTLADIDVNCLELLAGVSAGTGISRA